jgi:membrane fusion protein (multidrug efflux system)
MTIAARNSTPLTQLSVFCTIAGKHAITANQAVQQLTPISVASSAFPDRPGQASRIKRYLILIGAMLAPLIALTFTGSYLWNYFQSYESTEAARIIARTTPINAYIDGTITGLYAEPFQRVKGGQLLVQLDPRDREIAVEEASSPWCKWLRLRSYRWWWVTQTCA